MFFFVPFFHLIFRYFISSVILIFFLLCVVSKNIMADSVGSGFDYGVQIQQINKQERQNLERGRNLQEINRVRAKSEAGSAESESLSLKDSIDDKCRKIDKLSVSGNRELNLEKFILSNRGKCLAKSDLQNLKVVIENYYIEHGYILARVYFGLENISQGEIKVIVEEGRVDSLKIKDDSKINDFAPWRRRMQELFAFGIYHDRVVNLRDIEQGLEQMNRLSSNNAKMDIVPSDRVGEGGVVGGYADVIINNQVGNITKPSIAINNSGNKNTGQIRESIVLDQDNLIGVGDNIYFSHSRSDDHSVDKKYFASNYLAISIPFNYYNFGGSYSDSKYLTTTKGNLATSLSSGTSQSSSYYISRVLFRSKKYKLSLKAELNSAGNDNYLNNELQVVNSRKLTVAKFSLDNVYYTKFGTIFLQPKYNKGTKLIGALKDAGDLKADAQRAQFNSYGLYGSISNNFLIPKTNINLSHNLAFDSQISEDSLFASEQISIGGRYNVRGFNESSISGDNGYYIKNDLMVNLAQIVPVVIRSSFLSSVLQKTNIGAFYDYGYVRNKFVNDVSSEGYMSGAGVKLVYNGQYFKVDLTYSKGLRSPQFLQNVYHIPRDNESIYCDLKLGLF